MSNCLDKDLLSEFHLQLDVAALQQLYILLKCIALLAVVSLWYLQLHYHFGMFRLIEICGLKIACKYITILKSYFPLGDVIHRLPLCIYRGAKLRINKAPFV